MPGKKLTLEISESLFEKLEKLAELTEESIESLAIQIIASRIPYRIEQAGRRPALAISKTRYNRRVGLVLVCPITTKAKGYAFEVPILEGLAVSGVVLADQVKSFDWQSRQAEFACQIHQEVLIQVVSVITNLLNGVLN